MPTISSTALPFPANSTRLMPVLTTASSSSSIRKIFRIPFWAAEIGLAKPIAINGFRGWSARQPLSDFRLPAQSALLKCAESERFDERWPRDYLVVSASAYAPVWRTLRHEASVWGVRFGLTQNCNGRLHHFISFPLHNQSLIIPLIFSYLRHAKTGLL